MSEAGPTWQAFLGEGAELYDDRIRRIFGGFDLYHHLGAAELVAELEDAPSILCLGAGKGEEVNRIRSLRPNARLTAVEPSPDMVEVGRQRHSTLDWIEGEIGDAPEGPFDGATGHLVLHFLDDEPMAQAVDGLARRLASGAPLVLGVVVADDLSRVWPVWMADAGPRLKGVDVGEVKAAIERDVRLRPLAAYRTALEKAGFTDVRLWFRHTLFAGLSARRS